MGNTLGKLQTKVNELEKKLVELQDRNSELIEEKKSLTSKLKYLEESFDKKLETALTKAVKEVSEKYDNLTSVSVCVNEGIGQGAVYTKSLVE